MGILTKLRQGERLDLDKPNFHDERLSRYDLYLSYYKNEETDASAQIEKPLRVNYVRRICEIHNSFLWGQWQGSIVNWRVVPKRSGNPLDKNTAEKIEDFVYDVWDYNSVNRILFEAGLNGSLLGDTVFKTYHDPFENAVRISNVDPLSFFPTWDPDDNCTMRKVMIAYQISREDAKEIYGTAGNAGMFGDDRNALFREIWTKAWWSIYVDDVVVKREPNPYGFIPYTHIPNVRVPNEPWGVSDVADILRLQDELNMRLADNADDINYHAHPIIKAKNVPSKTNLAELPVGPDEVWDCGKEGDYEALIWEGPGEGTMNHIALVREILEDTSGVTPTAFGRHKGTQRSGIALQVEMLPISQRSTWKRLIWDEALKAINDKIVRIGGKYGLVEADLTGTGRVRVSPIWAPILPRDRSALVNENIAMVKAFLRSRVKALNELGEEDAEEELDRIIAEAGEMMEKGVGLDGKAEGADKQEQVTGEGLKYVTEV